MTGAAMASESRRRVWRPGCEPLPASELTAAVGDTSVALRVDGPRPSSSSVSSGTRNVTGEGLEWSTEEVLVFAACFEPFWTAAETVEQHINATFMPAAGRKRLHTVFEAHLFGTAAKLVGGYRAAERTLGNPSLWRRLAGAVARAYPGHPDRRLSPMPIRRHHFAWLRKHHLGDDALAQISDIMTQAALEAIVQMGGLDPAAGSVTHPTTTQLITGDGTWIPALHQASKRKRLEAARNGKTLRSDPDAVAYHNENSPGGSRGFMAVMGQWRSPHRQERVVTFFDLRPRGKSDATVFTDMTLEARQRHPGLTAGMHGIVYDMALASEDIDRLLDGGLNPISKVPRTSNGHPAGANLGDHTFRLASIPGQQTAMRVLAIDGPPVIEAVDSNGVIHYVALVRARTYVRKHSHRRTWYSDFTVPDHPLVPPHLVGATTAIRHSSTTHERQTRPHRRRTRALRVTSEHDPDFDKIYGLREDSESNISTYKRTLHHGRARAVGGNSLRLDLLSYQGVTMITALVAHHRRTGASLKGWFGSRPPPYRGDPTG